MKTRADGLLENEAGRGAGSATPLGGESGKAVRGESGAAQGETLGQRVVVGLPRARWWGARKSDEVSVQSGVREAPVRKGTGMEVQEETA